MTCEATGSERERVLDRCIDALIEGRSWRDELPPCEQAEELEQLLRVAEDVLAAGHRIPPPSGSAKEQLWRRIVRAAMTVLRPIREGHQQGGAPPRRRAVIAAIGALLM